MVLAPFGPAVTVDPSGLNQQSGMRSVPVSQGGTIAQTVTDGDLNIAVQSQGPVPQFNPVQECMQFAGEFARIYSLANGVTMHPMAAIIRIIDIYNAIRSESYNA